MRLVGVWLGTALLVLSCAAPTTPSSRVVDHDPRPEARVDSSRWGSILWLDVDALRRLDASAPRETLLRDVIGGDPLLNALLPEGWRSLGDLRRIEYRARRFAGSEWMLLLSLEEGAEDFLEGRSALPEEGGWRPTSDAESFARAVAATEIQIASPLLLDEERGRARLLPPFDLSPDMIGAWHIPGARAQYAGQRETTPAEVTLVARRAAGEMLVRIEAGGRYEDEAAARRGWAHWERTRRRLAASVAMQLAGLARPVADGRLELEGERIVFRTAFDALELRLVLAVVARLHGRPEVVATRPPG